MTTIHLIRALSPEALDDDGDPLWWSNDHGWVPVGDATVFTEAEHQTFDLRQLGGEWVTFTTLPASLWVLTIDHKHGANVTLHSSEQDAQDAVYEHAAQWWEEVRTSETEMIPDDHAEAVETYFERHSYEGWRIEEVVFGG